MLKDYNRLKVSIDCVLMDFVESIKNCLHFVDIEKASGLSPFNPTRKIHGFAGFVLRSFFAFFNLFTKKQPLQGCFL
jgi:hypothetical protein